MSGVLRHIGRNLRIGEGVRIWHFTYIGDGAEIGDGTKIGSLVHVDYGVKIGRNCEIKGMVYIPPLTVIEDDVFQVLGVISANDLYPTSKMARVYSSPARIWPVTYDPTGGKNSIKTLR